MTNKLALPTLITLSSIALSKPTVSSLVVLGEISISGTIIKVDELAMVLDPNQRRDVLRGQQLLYLGAQGIHVAHQRGLHVDGIGGHRADACREVLCNDLSHAWIDPDHLVQFARVGEPARKGRKLASKIEPALSKVAVDHKALAAIDVARALRMEDHCVVVVLAHVAAHCGGI